MRLRWLALAALAACTSPTIHTTDTVPTPTSDAPTTNPTTTTAIATTTSTSLVATTTTVAIDPSYADVPIGTCDTIAPGAIGYRNDTGRTADQYLRIGTSAQGRPIWAEHWGAASGAQVLVLGQVHGDECAPAWFVQAVRAVPPTDFGIWLVPTMNPDGLAAHTRLTAQGIDPNRDGFRLETPEAQSVMAFTSSLRPVLTLHLHSPYRWVGAHNEGIARTVAQAMSDAVGWGVAYNAGRVRDGDLAFLWEGQERMVEGHPSVLVEFPAVAEAESPNPPKPAEKDVTSVDDVARIAVSMRDAFYSAMTAALTGTPAASSASLP
ncbi:MAG: hypothetical protein RI900_3096 [Actinomycetota bacterium]|jgi:hypothetical protein